MQTKAALYFLIGFFLISIAEIASHAYAASTPTKGESLDELHEKTKKEGGKLNLYASLSGNSIDVILPAFQKRFPGVTVDHTDATGDKLIARIVAEGRGGRVIADVFGGGLSYIAQMAEQKLLAPLTIPEAAAYPAHLKNEFGSPRTRSISSLVGTPTSSKKAKSPKVSKILPTRSGRAL